MPDVDAELFDSIEDAIAFVAERGGGVVRTDLAHTDYAKTIKLPTTVRLERPISAEEAAVLADHKMHNGG